MGNHLAQREALRCQGLQKENDGVSSLCVLFHAWVSQCQAEYIDELRYHPFRTQLFYKRVNDDVSDVG